MSDPTSTPAPGHEADERWRANGNASHQAGLQAAILNALPAHVALIDPDGIILAVNESWQRFTTTNPLHSHDSSVGHNYLDLCDRASGETAGDAHAAAVGIRQVLHGELESLRSNIPVAFPSRSAGSASPSRRSPTTGYSARS